MPVSHQQAMLDWLHWGGQIVFIGGAGPTLLDLPRELPGPYLPAEPTGENKLLGEAELRPLATPTLPPCCPALPPDQEDAGARRIPGGVLPAGPAVPAARADPAAQDPPVFLPGLRPRPGAATIPLGEGSPHLLAVEGRVGRGRITMLTINPTDPSLASWPGLDTLIRRVVLRRPEEGRVPFRHDHPRHPAAVAGQCWRGPT